MNSCLTKEFRQTFHLIRHLFRREKLNPKSKNWFKKHLKEKWKEWEDKDISESSLLSHTIYDDA
ncbi:CLUMA_CG000321, isoform A [Clunio marinus]|uniref:CLUMA_CG000321, isoform A n=1 Tax=Clunio marinus TaxID=568069 RepID=A0A1J1HF11_9DIPT|nr:CLUMA_CG000321, isoform A [Clunio marinus]